ncbi:MAG: hypothetical protein K0S61_4925 [Anaerocolumna sp.]|nr:hypothetical protein [Anaerocolumna sp.]
MAKCHNGLVSGGFNIDTLEGTMEASVGDYIIKGVSGEIYPCKPDIFEKTYEHVFVPEDSNGICEDTEKSKITGTTVDVSVKNSFGYALELLKHGKAVTRKGWNGKGMFVYYVPENSYKTITDVAKKEFGEYANYSPYLAIKNINGTISTWVPSINDCLAEDWEEVEL